MRRLAVFAMFAVLGACAATPVPTVPDSAERPSAPRTSQPSLVATVSKTPAPTPTASPTPNRPARPGSPPIAEPYWLLFSGTSTATMTDADGTVVETTRGDSYEVLSGGSLEGTILINGELVGSLRVNATEGQAIRGLDPIEQQYGAQIDDELPPPGVQDRSPNPFWAREEQRRDGGDVFLRVPASPQTDDGYPSFAFWWDAAHEKWYQLNVFASGDFQSVLTALLGSAE